MNKKPNIFTVRVSSSLRDSDRVRLEILAKANDVTISEYIRGIIIDALADEAVNRLQPPPLKRLAHLS